MKTNLSAKLVATAALSLATALGVGCAATNEDAAQPTTTASNGSSGSARRACENVKSLAQICYDSADPGVSCPALGDAMRGEAAKKGLDVGLQNDLGTMCQSACAQRKSGGTWSEMSARVDCASRY
jgi:hypothetical protein